MVATKKSQCGPGTGGRRTRAWPRLGSPALKPGWCLFPLALRVKPQGTPEGGRNSESQAHPACWVLCQGDVSEGDGNAILDEVPTRGLGVLGSRGCALSGQPHWLPHTPCPEEGHCLRLGCHWSLRSPWPERLARCADPSLTPGICSLAGARGLPQLTGGKLLTC